MSVVLRSSQEALSNQDCHVELGVRALTHVRVLKKRDGAEGRGGGAGEASGVASGVGSGVASGELSEKCCAPVPWSRSAR